MKDINDFFVEPEEATAEELKEAMALLAKKKVRAYKIQTGLIKGGKKWADFTEEEKAAYRTKEKEKRIRKNLLIQRAIEAGITITDEEVQQALSLS